jgi:MinD-like ATPase involved in chromosome partitioning or flagellar assembly
MAEGRIITFYSFKGGVGRTMALANVAYLAAQNRKRVLVMDWDLEALTIFVGLLSRAKLRRCGKHLEF